MGLILAGEERVQGDPRGPGGLPYYCADRRLCRTTLYIGMEPQFGHDTCSATLAPLMPDPTTTSPDPLWDRDDPGFAPEPYTDFYRHGLYHGLLARMGRTVEQLRLFLDPLRPDRLLEEVRADAQAALGRQGAIHDRYRYLRDYRFSAARIRVHGDHLAQVLYTGKDFVAIDFEGDASHPLSERRIKRSPLGEVAGLLDSYYHAAHAALYGQPPIRALIRIFLIDHAFRKLACELTHAPERIRVPAPALNELLEAVV
jgi:predicted trehalose synthase